MSHWISIDRKLGIFRPCRKGKEAKDKQYFMNQRVRKRHDLKLPKPGDQRKFTFSTLLKTIKLGGC